MASPFFQELIDTYGEKEAERIYRGVTAEYGLHVEKHAAAIVAEGKAVDVLAVVARVKADPTVSMTAALHEDAEGRQR